jgi:putative nucleotidyltransferase with HDIG domain
VVEEMSGLRAFSWNEALRSDLSIETRRANRAAGVFSVVVVDLDDSDALKKLAADEVSLLIEALEDLVRSNIRRTDRVYALPKRGCAIIAPETARRDAFALIQRLALIIRSKLALSVTFGAAEHPSDGQDEDQLMRAALLNAQEARAARTSSLYTWDIERTEIPGVLDILLTALAARDRYLLRHARLTARVTAELARTLGYSPPDQELFYVAGLLHDIGKIILPDRILRKPDPLTPPEMALVQQHVPVGKLIVEEARGVRRTADFIAHHHERFDGNGYPYGLDGSDISIGGRMLAAASAYAAMRLDTPYRAARSRAEALVEIERGSGTRYDPSIVRALRAAVEHLEAAAEARSISDAALLTGGTGLPPIAEHADV